MNRLLGHGFCDIRQFASASVHTPDQADVFLLQLITQFEWSEDLTGSYIISKMVVWIYALMNNEATKRLFLMIGTNLSRYETPLQIYLLLTSTRRKNLIPYYCLCLFGKNYVKGHRDLRGKNCSSADNFLPWHKAFLVVFNKRMP